ncbi:hypothetical protein AbraIFM66951_009804 [Aspergillus brasiliensis]|uniref:Uncharacterized protein n=1 Tax=Aspergillus brasiliensis TaxID=319629 RepID=A0A9W5YN71_9EURO|nr:hypothetical protein AbraCBS73388_004721 [Aspergillus brasiliensis]GKZ46665.1 hypothetical protein AbraIFM66951_009804 [Aspergillus brasiliensis]
MQSSSHSNEHGDCAYPLFDVNRLEEPAETDTLFGKSIQTIKNSLMRTGRKGYDKLLKFHGWGYGYEMTSHSLQPRHHKLAILLKVLWNQAEYHQPQSVDELFDFTRDAGPRLLKQELIRDWDSYLPISRYYPDPPEALPTSAPHTNRPDGAPSAVPDGYLERMRQPASCDDSSESQLSSLDEEILDPGSPKEDETMQEVEVEGKGKGKGKEKEKEEEEEEEEEEQLEDNPYCSEGLERVEGDPSTSRGDQGAEEKMTEVDEDKTSERDAGDPMEEDSSDEGTPTQMTGAEAPATRHRGSLSRRRSSDELISEAITDPNAAVSRPQQSQAAAPLSNKDTVSATEAVERAVMSLTYNKLERHPTAVPYKSQLWVPAVAKRYIRSLGYDFNPLTAGVKIHNTQGHRITPHPTTGCNYTYRGRGPVCANFLSSVTGCAIVAGRLLDAGSTNIDREQQGWQQDLTVIQRLFIEVTDIQWDMCENQNQKEYQLGNAYSLSLSPRKLPPHRHLFQYMRQVWCISTQGFNQFALAYKDAIGKPCECAPSSNNGAITNDHSMTAVEPPMAETDRNGVEIKDVLSRTFAPQGRIDCVKCKKRGVISYERRFSKVPMRLVVGLPPGVSIRSHTEDFTLAYHDEHGHEQSATYRWLGGFYLYDDHIRLYWNDAERGERGEGMLRMYDGLTNGGLILGNIPPHSRTERVPEVCRNQTIPLLFYERVMNPSIEVIQGSIRAVDNMRNHVSQGRLILQQSPGWAPPERSLVNEGPYPWAPLLPEAGEESQEAQNSKVCAQPKAQPQAQPKAQLQAQPQAQLQAQPQMTQPRMQPQARRRNEAVRSRIAQAQPYPARRPPPYVRSNLSFTSTPNMSADLSTSVMSASSFVGSEMQSPAMGWPHLAGSSSSSPGQASFPPLARLSPPLWQGPPPYTEGNYGAAAASPFPMASASSRQTATYSPIHTNPGPHAARQTETNPMQLTNPDGSSAYGDFGYTMMGQSSSPLPYPEQPHHPDNWVNRSGHPRPGY